MNKTDSGNEVISSGKLSQASRITNKLEDVSLRIKNIETLSNTIHDELLGIIPASETSKEDCNTINNGFLNEAFIMLGSYQDKLGNIEEVLNIISENIKR